MRSSDLRGEIDMQARRGVFWILSVPIVPVLFCALLGVAQTGAAPAAPAASPMLNDKDVAATQVELIRLLRLSPTLTTVVSHDPSLLADQEYVARNNPQLAAFLTAHPEVSRNPEYFLFSHLNHEHGQPDEALERAVWPDVYRIQSNYGPLQEFTHDLSPLLAFLGFLVALTWMIRVFVENRRWGRIFKLQSEVHGRLIDKFSSNQELAAYMETEAGKRFLEAAPIPVNMETSQRVPNAVARVLTPLQIGVVLVLLGTGFMLLRHAGPDLDEPMLIFGTVTLMPGIGFILSAGITWLLAARLGLMPPPATQNQSGSPYGPRQ
jgi:hypothetical protein